MCSYSTPSELEVLEKTKFYQTFDPGQDIVSEGENTATLGSIIDGVVALQKTLEDGRRQMVGLLFPSDFIGRPLRPVAPYDAVAVTPVRMCLFHRTRFEALLSQNVNLERRLLEMTLNELDAAREWMLLLGRKTAAEKLASFIMILARRASALQNATVKNGLEVPIPLTREAIAEFLGLTIETVSRQFTGLRKQGFIELSGTRSLVLTDVGAVAALAGVVQEDALTDLTA
ncbi:MAG: Crp/Fnr family transcriptional regulator [Pseudomonadota bacterium]